MSQRYFKIFPREEILLLLANLLTIFIFVRSNGSLMQVLWIYWLQNVILGAINVFRILSLPDSVQIDNAKLAVNLGFKTARGVKLSHILFFCYHYGFFILGHAIFLKSFDSATTMWGSNTQQTSSVNFGDASLLTVLFAGLGFAIHHFMHFLIELHNHNHLPISSVDFKKPLMGPYPRIIPIHIIILTAVPITFYVGQEWVFIAFMALKTVVDLFFDAKETK